MEYVSSSLTIVCLLSIAIPVFFINVSDPMETPCNYGIPLPILGDGHGKNHLSFFQTLTGDTGYAIKRDEQRV